MTDEPVVACLSVPALPLQLLRLRHPDWQEHPMAVLDEDRPTGRILFVSQRAWESQVRPGMRYAAGLSLCGSLRAGVVTEAELRMCRDDLVQTLRRFSPSVECSGEHQGVFWAGVVGLGRLYASLEAWGAAVEREVVGLGYRGTLVIGYERFATCALALARHVGRVLESPAHEQRVLRQVPIDRLRLDPALLSGLEGLGIRTVGQLLRLSRSEVVRRYGEAAERLYMQAREGARVPVQADVPLDEVRRVVEFEHVEHESGRLLRAISAEVPGLIGALVARDEVVVELCVTLWLERPSGARVGGTLEERVRPASPTLDEALLLDLIRLRLEASPLSAGVIRCALSVVTRRACQEQSTLCFERPRRDVGAANRAMAQLRAELGPDAVGILVEGDGYIPESGTKWMPIERLDLPGSVEARPGRLVRRLYAQPQPLPPRPRQEPDGWLVRGPQWGPVVEVSGPHVLAGGWWSTEIDRAYQYLETSKGHMLWTFYDRRRRRWFLQGVIE